MQHPGRVLAQQALKQGKIPSASDFKQYFELIAKIHNVIENAKAAGATTDTIASLSLTPRLDDEFNAFLRRYSVSPSTLNALVQPLMADSDLQRNQLFNAVIQLARSRPQLSQLISTLFSSMDPYLAQGESRLAAARHTVEQWFDDAMDRTSGWYKRSTQLWLGLVGFALACALNVDTLTVGTALWRDPTLRQNTVELVQKYQLSPPSDDPSVSGVEEAANAIRELNAQLSQELQLPIGWRTQAVELPDNSFCAPIPMNRGDVWGLPTGQGCLQLTEAASNQSAGPLAKLLGLFLTAVAVSQGAPFWFDLLSRLTNPRGSGPVPPPSQEKTRAKVEAKGEIVQVAS